MRWNPTPRNHDADRHRRGGHAARPCQGGVSCSQMTGKSCHQVGAAGSDQRSCRCRGAASQPTRWNSRKVVPGCRYEVRSLRGTACVRLGQGVRRAAIGGPAVVKARLVERRAGAVEARPVKRRAGAAAKWVRRGAISGPAVVGARPVERSTGAAVEGVRRAAISGLVAVDVRLVKRRAVATAKWVRRAAISSPAVVEARPVKPRASAATR
jgi:hypothetical protein